MKKYNSSLFIFRRDLRLADNSGLIAALKESKHVIPCFIFDPRQVETKNKYRSTNAIQFMIESLKDLSEQLKKQNGRLYLFYGKAEEVVEKLLSTTSIDAVFINRDYTPFSTKRDAHIKKICTQHEVSYEENADALLNEPEDIQKKDGSFYSVFTPFYKNASRIAVQEPAAFPSNGDWFTGTLDGTEKSTLYKTILPDENADIAVNGGSAHGHTILNHLAHFNKYEHERNYPGILTSRLSAHLKFGTISVRQTYNAIVKHLGAHHPLLRQLYWRDFFTHIAHHAPHVFGHAYHTKYDSLKWDHSAAAFKAWSTGNTGFPIVDAGMRELNTTGFMHNRVRMIVASFLVKDLHINWLSGEQYFAQQLVDYDASVNNGNWQWSASTGCDAQPYFRIFNPWLQQKKYDPDCTYIKQWVPELDRYDAKTIHGYYKENSPVIPGYPRPIVDHARESDLAKKMYKSTSRK